MSAKAGHCNEPGCIALGGHRTMPPLDPFDAQEAPAPTPGPWYCGYVAAAAATVGQFSGGWGVLEVSRPGGGPLAMARGINSEADARLMAAASEMAALLDEIHAVRGTGRHVAIGRIPTLLRKAGWAS